MTGMKLVGLYFLLQHNNNRVKVFQNPSRKIEIFDIYNGTTYCIV
jgi:hypothetical protein